MADTALHQILFVLGMHRSGTSALCAALQAAGASFGDELLEPMAGVNDEGFWEDETFVALNDELLLTMGRRWFDLLQPLPADWLNHVPDALVQRADTLLQRGFGGAPLQAVKDPRLCFTLPFWLQRCAAADITAHCCVIERDQAEVAASLQRRDGLPVSYGLRLAHSYRDSLRRVAPEAAPVFAFEALLENPAEIIGALIAAGLPLSGDSEAIRTGVRPELRNQRARDLPEEMSLEQVLADLVGEFILRGQELTRIGEQHSAALATLADKDTDIDKLGEELRAALKTIDERDTQVAGLDARLQETGTHLEQALATIVERDEQIAEFDRRLHETGQMHGEALAYINELEARLERVFDKPVSGRLFRRMWASEDPEARKE